MKTKDIEFNADDLVGSIEAFAHHLTGKQKLTARGERSVPWEWALESSTRNAKPGTRNFDLLNR
jgi:hypothetical protein